MTEQPNMVGYQDEETEHCVRIYATEAGVVIEATNADNETAEISMPVDHWRELVRRVDALIEGA